MSTFPFLINANAPSPVSSLLDSFDSSGTGEIPTEVRGDVMWAIQITPVIPDPTGQYLWQYDGLSTDVYRFAIGNKDEAPTSGAAIFDLNGTAFTLQFDDTTAEATAAVQAASTAEGYGTVTATLQVSGNAWILQWAANGAVPAITETSNTLNPASAVTRSVIVAGDASNPAQQIIQFAQQPVVYGLPVTLLPAASLTNATAQAPTSSANAIRKITFNAAGTYGGTFSVSLVANGITEGVGVGNAAMTSEEFGLLLANHSLVNFQEPDGTADNINVTKSGLVFIVEFIGTLGSASTSRTITTSSAANPSVVTTSVDHGYVTGQSVTISGSTNAVINTTATITVTGVDTFTVPNAGAAAGTGGTAYNVTQAANNLTATNIDLLAPIGVSGFVSFNSVNLWKYFQTTTADSLDFTLEIERERASGEIKTLLQVPITLLRDLITGTTLAPMPNGGTVFVGQEFRIISSANGGTIQVSNDNGATWESVVVYTHS